MALVSASVATGSPQYEKHGGTCDSHDIQFHRHRARQLLKHAYESQPSRAEIEAYQVHRRCIRDEDVRASLAALRDRLKAKWEYRREVDALTPYGKWAIPESIVMCESGGSWSAYNPSGAVGPYQLLGHGAPFPVTSKADKLAHHRIASDLWAGGAGRSAWEC